MSLEVYPKYQGRLIRDAFEGFPGKPNGFPGANIPAFLFFYLSTASTTSTDKDVFLNLYPSIPLR
jgi:hypothetical protein